MWSIGPRGWGIHRPNGAAKGAPSVEEENE